MPLVSRACRQFTPAALLLGLAWAVPATAQVKASERATLTQDISGTEVSINYSRPSTRGRDTIFGSEVTWDEVWTPGANMSTKLRFSKDVTLDGHAVEAGTYGVWIQVKETGPWTFMLHPDTTLFHVPHAKIEDGILAFPVTPETMPERRETLTWDVQNIRATGADLEMRWADTRVAVAIGVDLGITLTTPEAEARRYTGTWHMTNLKTFTDSAEAAWKADMSPEEIAEFDEWFLPREVRFEYDTTRGWLVVEEDLDEPAGEPDVLLLPKGEGRFAPGYLFRGELGFLQQGDEWTFTFDDAGIATALESRNARDQVDGHARRLTP